MRIKKPMEETPIVCVPKDVDADTVRRLELSGYFVIRINCDKVYYPTQQAVECKK